MRILVTGATGFIGRHAVRELAEDGHEMLSSSRTVSGPQGAQRHISYDFAGKEPFPDVGCLDAVVHLAGNGNAQDSWGDLTQVAQLNAQGTLRALDVAARTAAAFVLASTQRVYRPDLGPIAEDGATHAPDPYGYTKLAAELYVDMASRLLSVPGVILRLFSVYGPGQRIQSGQSGVVAILGQRAIENQPLVVMTKQHKDFVAVDDVVEAIRCALRQPAMPARSYNIATGTATTVLELARVIRDVAGSTSEIIEDYRDSAPGHLVADISRARAELGYEPRIPLKEGLRQYVDWLRDARAHSA